MPYAIHCPHCQAGFRVSESSAGHKAKCKRCGEAFVIPSVDEAAAAAILNFADEPDPTPAAAPTPPSTRPAPARVLQLDLAPSHKAVAQASAPEVRKARRTATDPVRGFWADAAMSFVVHFRGRGPFVFVLLVFLSCLPPILEFAGRHGWWAIILIYGFIWSYYFNIIQDTCAGEDILPEMGLGLGESDWFSHPLLLYLASLLWAFLPLLIWLGVWWGTSVVAGIDLDKPALGPTIGLAGLGMFMWPMVILTIAINGFTLDTLRYDKQLDTIGRAFLSYLAVWCLVLVTFGGRVVLDWLVPPFLSMRDLTTTSMAELATRALTCLGAAIANIYLSIAAMRIIGLFYRHHKRHFAWVAE